MKYSIFWFLFSLALLLAFETQSNRQAIAQSNKASATMEEIINNTNNWVSKTVTIKGTFDEMKDDNTLL